MWIELDDLFVLARLDEHEWSLMQRHWTPATESMEAYPVVTDADVASLGMTYAGMRAVIDADAPGRRTTAVTSAMNRFTQAVGLAGNF